MTNSIGTSAGFNQGNLLQTIQPVIIQKLDIQGLLTKDGLLNPAFFNVAQSDLLKILDRLTQKSLSKATTRQEGKHLKKSLSSQLRRFMVGVGQMEAQKRGLLFNQAAIEMTSDQLEQLYLAAPEDHLSLELIDSIASHGQRIKQEVLYKNIASYKDYIGDGSANTTDSTAIKLLEKCLGI